MNREKIIKLAKYGTPPDRSIDYFNSKISSPICDEKEFGDLAKENQKRLILNLQESTISARILEAETVSKKGCYQESNNLLNNILNEVPSNLIIMSVVVFKRLAINYRKLKEYDNEVRCIKKFLSDFQPLYGKSMWKQEFEDRLTKAQALSAKSKYQ